MVACARVCPMTKLLNHDRGFWAIAFALMVVIANSAFPTPLYGLYAARDAFGARTITASFTTYAPRGGFGWPTIVSRLATCASRSTIPLSLVGHLSAVYGRKRARLPGLA